MMIQAAARVSRLRGRSARSWTALVFVRRLLWTSVVIGLAGAGPGCASRPTLVDTRDSPEALARAVLEAFGGRDVRALAGLALSEREFREVVWPELPASRPERNLPFGYVWGDLDQKSRARLGVLLANHGGKRFTLSSIAFTGETTSYGAFSVLRDSELRVVDESGQSLTLRLFGSVLKTGDGRFKVFSYNVDD